jgi:hypothetical protein
MHVPVMGVEASRSRGEKASAGEPNGDRRARDERTRAARARDKACAGLMRCIAVPAGPRAAETARGPGSSLCKGTCVQFRSDQTKQKASISGNGWRVGQKARDGSGSELRGRRESTRREPRIQKERAKMRGRHGRKCCACANHKGARMRPREEACERLTTKWHNPRESSPRAA